MDRRAFLWGGTALLASAARVRAAVKEGVAWYGTWERGVAEAKRLKRPILLISAAPQCNHVSGMW